MSKICCIQYGVVMIGGNVDGSPVDLIRGAGKSKQNITFLCVLYEFAPMIVFVDIGMLADIGGCKCQLLKGVPWILRVLYHIFIAAVQLRSGLFQ